MWHDWAIVMGHRFEEEGGVGRGVPVHLGWGVGLGRAGAAGCGMTQQLSWGV